MQKTIEQLKIQRKQLIEVHIRILKRLDEINKVIFRFESYHSWITPEREKELDTKYSSVKLHSLEDVETIITALNNQ